MTQEQLLEAIEAYLNDSGVSAAQFGRAALGDPNFVYQLRRNERELRRATIARAVAALPQTKKRKAA